MEAKSLPSSRNSESEVSATVARYLEAVYYIAHEGEIVRPSRLAEWLGVSPPTVTGLVQRLRDQGLIVISPDHSLTLAAEGVTAASVIVRRHRVVERWLTDEIGLDWAAADEEAGRISHAFSDQLIDRILTKLGSPGTCPHGNEIPGVEGPARSLVNLANLGPGLVAPISRVSEVAEHEAPQLLSLLDREGLRIGVEVAVIRPSGAEAVTVLRGAHQTALGLGAATAVWVDLNQARDPEAADRDPGDP
ncbi:MAG: metal-dependent transcriptional regulator [Candidatus Dormibacteria bacterium]